MFFDLVKKMKQGVAAFREGHLRIQSEIDEVVITEVFQLWHPWCSPWWFEKNANFRKWKAGTLTR